MSTIPFDLNYIPDFVFDTGFQKLATAFPNDVTIATSLNLSPTIPVNMARLALIIDDYLVQFSGNGNVYLLNIPHNKLITTTIAHIVAEPNGNTWLIQTAIAAMTMINAIDSNRQAFNLYMAYFDVLCQQTETFLGNNNPKSIELIKNNLGLSNPNGLTLKHRAWDFEKHHVTWGRIANLLFSKYYREHFDWHK